MSVPMERLREVEDLLNERCGIPYGHISFWDRNSAYDQRAFDQSEAVIVILPNFSFDSTKIRRAWTIPIGVHRELQIAEKQAKKIFLAYKTTEGVLQFYAANIFIGLGDQHTDTVIKGMAGTSGPNGAFCGWLKTLDSKESEIKETWKSLGIDAQAELEKMINQDELEKAAIRLMENSTYGIKLKEVIEEPMEIQPTQINLEESTFFKGETKTPAAAQNQLVQNLQVNIGLIESALLIMDKVQILDPLVQGRVVNIFHQLDALVQTVNERINLNK